MGSIYKREGLNKGLFWVHLCLEEGRALPNKSNAMRTNKTCHMPIEQAIADQRRAWLRKNSQAFFFVSP